ncbi:MAG: pentapeptide repeat-containing protein [Actinomycetota bacterium]
MSTPRGSDLVTAGLALFAAGALAQGAMAVDTPFFEGRDVSEVIGSGSRTCTLKPRADCRGVVDRWNIEHHGNLRKIRFTRANIVGADLRGADLRGARLDGAKFSSLPRRGKRANQAQGCSVGGCDVTVLTSIRAEGAALPMADMSCGQLYCAPGTGPLFENAQMGGTDLSGANLAGATTNQAVQVIYSVDTLNLQSANLTGANVVNANLAGATAINANMTGANLTGANLSWANLSGATLQSANATRTNFANAEFLYTNLNGVTWDATTCPSGTVSSTGC